MDFSLKGGPAELIGVDRAKRTITWADGNVGQAGPALRYDDFKSTCYMSGLPSASVSAAFACLRSWSPSLWPPQCVAPTDEKRVVLRGVERCPRSRRRRSSMASSECHSQAREVVIVLGAGVAVHTRPS